MAITVDLRDQPVDERKVIDDKPKRASPTMPDYQDGVGEGPARTVKVWELESLGALGRMMRAQDIGLADRETLEDVDRNLDERTLTVVSTGAVLPICYGKVRLGVKMGYPWVAARWLRFPSYWCLGRIQSIRILYDGVEETRYTLSHYFGTQTQTLDSYLSAGIGYTDTHPGVAYSVLKVDAESDPTNIIAEIEGRRVYDPRKDSTSGVPGAAGSQRVNDETTWAYSTNPVLALADFHQLYRKNIESINWLKVAECADYVDEELEPGVKRSEIGMVIDRRSSFQAHFDALAEYALVYAYFDDDTLCLVPDKSSTPVASITESDIIAGTEDFGILDAEDAPDQVIVKFTDTTKEPWTEGIAQTPQPAGGAKNPQIIPMSGWQSHQAAYRYAILRQNKFNLLNFVGQFQTFDNGLKYVKGDVIEVTHSRGLAAKKMTVTDVTAVGLSRYEVKLVEYQPVWSNVILTDPVYDDVAIPSPTEFPTVTGLAAAEELWQTEAGIWNTVFDVTFNGGDWPHTSGFRYNVYRTSDGLLLAEGLITYQGEVSHGFITPPTTQGEEWTIKVWVVNKFGAHDPATFASTTVTGNGKTIPPLNIPAGTLKSVEYGQFVRLSWAAAADSDLSGYQVARLNEADYDADVAAENDPFDNVNALMLVDRIDSLYVLLDAQPAGITGSQTWAYGVRPIDREGNTAEGRWVKQLVTAESAGALGTAELDHMVSSLTNMSTHEVFGVGICAYVDVGDSWEDRFGIQSNNWPADQTEPWIHNLSVTGTYSVTTVEWDTGADRSGNWAWQPQLVKVYGGATVTYQTQLAVASAYPTFTTHASKQVNAEARYLKGKMTMTSSDPDEAFSVLFPVDASYQGQIMEDAVDVSILNQVGPTAFSWTKSFSDIPDYWFVLKGTTPLIVALDSVTKDGGNAKAWTTGGADAAAEITVYGKGP